mgnify:CR=1 FL=1
MEYERMKEWLDKIAAAQTVINENEFLDPDRKYEEAVICNNRHIQIMSGGHIDKLASVLGLEIITEPSLEKNTEERSFIYKGIKFLALERLVKKDVGTD